VVDKSLQHAFPVVKWEKPWDFEDWKKAVLQGRQAEPEMLEKLYLQQWEPAACHEMMDSCHLFGLRVRAKGGYKPKDYDADWADKRIAKALWLETVKLLRRNLTAEGRQRVLQWEAWARQMAGVEVVGQTGKLFADEA
jgi:hypothetical protein